MIESPPGAGHRAGRDSSDTVTNGTVTILVAHGSRNPAAAVAHEDLVRAVADLSGLTVTGAYLEMTEPSIPAAIDAAVTTGARTVTLLPHFLHPGNHVANDIPNMVTAARARHPGTSIVVAQHTGADPAMVDLVARLARDAAATGRL